MPFLLKLMLSTPGRAIRIVLGAALTVYGLFFAGSIAGYAIVLVGIVVIALSAGDICVLAPLYGLSVEGKQTRAGVHR